MNMVFDFAAHAAARLLAAAEQAQKCALLFALGGLHTRPAHRPRRWWRRRSSGGWRGSRQEVGCGPALFWPALALQMLTCPTKCARDSRLCFNFDVSSCNEGVWSPLCDRGVGWTRQQSATNMSGFGCPAAPRMPRCAAARVAVMLWPCA
mgnify:CR=1 FL=1